MNKIFIIGIVGSGKTTFAKKISEIKKIEHYEVDAIAYKRTETGRVKQSLEAQIASFEDINQSDSWIIEGTYRPSCKCLFEKADCVLFLDPPLALRKYRIFTRYVKQKIGIEKSHYAPSFQMLKAMYKWTRDFEKTEKILKPCLRSIGISWWL